jgi:hypothetical protein
VAGMSDDAPRLRSPDEDTCNSSGGEFCCAEVAPDGCTDGAEIERLREATRVWQATAAGLSQDISNATDEINELRRAVEDLRALLEQDACAIEILWDAGDSLSEMLTELRALHGRDERVMAALRRWQDVRGT